MTKKKAREDEIPIKALIDHLKKWRKLPEGFAESVAAIAFEIYGGRGYDYRKRISKAKEALNSLYDYWDEGFTENFPVGWEEPSEYNLVRAIEKLLNVLKDEYLDHSVWKDPEIYWVGESVEQQKFMGTIKKQKNELRNKGLVIGTTPDNIFYLKCVTVLRNSGYNIYSKRSQEKSAAYSHY